MRGSSVLADCIVDKSKQRSTYSWYYSILLEMKPWLRNIKIVIKKATLTDDG